MEASSPLLTFFPRFGHMLSQEKNTLPQWVGCVLSKLKLMVYKYCKKANYQSNGNRLKECLLPDSLHIWPLGRSICLGVWKWECLECNGAKAAFHTSTVRKDILILLLYPPHKPKEDFPPWV